MKNFLRFIKYNTNINLIRIKLKYLEILFFIFMKLIGNFYTNLTSPQFFLEILEMTNQSSDYHI